ncbi:helix-turn-helix domain-containing protein [Streptomyces sp. NPDC047971]|uniref:helix-turn-helix domain-containing protein n=1 Tax=Streptomyces sp. NPDC047971 TaxID=3154499 RepID=UPI0033E37774
MADGGRHPPSWTFLTHHARVLLMLFRDPGVRLRDVAADCGVTERTVQAIVADLEAEGYLTRRRGSDGRRNQYEINGKARFRHPAEAGHEIAGLLALLSAPPRAGDTPPARERRTPVTTGKGHGEPRRRPATRRPRAAE